MEPEAVRASLASLRFQFSPNTIGADLDFRVVSEEVQNRLFETL